MVAGCELSAGTAHTLPHQTHNPVTKKQGTMLVTPFPSAGGGRIYLTLIVTGGSAGIGKRALYFYESLRLPSLLYAIIVQA